MPRPGLSRLRPLRKLLSSSSVSPHPQAAASSHSLPNSNFHQNRTSSLPHEAQEARLRFFSGSGNGPPGSGSLSLCRTFSVSRMQQEKFSGSGAETGDAIVEEDAEFDNAQGAAALRSGDDVSGDEQLSLESVEEGMVSDSSEEDLSSCEGVGEGFLEDSKPYSDPEGRRYLHVLSVEEVQTILEKVRADDVQVIPVRDLCEWADHLIVASGHSGRHLRGIADAIIFEVKTQSINVGDNVYPTVEDRESEQWLVVDCVSIVVHVFRDDVRGHYNLEEL